MVCRLFKGDAFLLCKYCNCILCFISYISISFFVCRYSFFVNLSYFCGQLRQFNLFSIRFLSKKHFSQRLSLSKIISFGDNFSQRLLSKNISLKQFLSKKKILADLFDFFLDQCTILVVQDFLILLDMKPCTFKYQINEWI